MPKAYWRLYSVLLGCLLLVMYATVFLASFRPIYLLDLPLTATAYVGLLGYSYHRRIATRQFWRVIFVSFIGWEIVFNFVLSSTGDVGVISIAMTMLVLFAPEYVALWRYGFRPNPLWAET